MSGAGRIIAVQETQDPQAAHRPALLLLTDADAPVQPDGRRCTAVFIDRVHPAPAIGDRITWGPHHVAWNGCRLTKIGPACDPTDPALYTG